MQNLVSMIQSAVPTEVSGKAASAKAGGGGLSELFAQLLQQFQGLALEGNTEVAAEAPSDGTEEAVVPEEATASLIGVLPEQAVNGEAQESVLAIKQAVLEKIATLELPESVNREQLVAVIKQAFSQGLSPEVVAQVSALVEQGRSPEVLAQLEAFLAPVAATAMTEAPAIQTATPAVQPSSAEVVANVTKANTPVVQGANPAVTKTQESVQAVPLAVSATVAGETTPVVKPEGVVTVAEQGKGPDGLEIPKTISASEVKPEGASAVHTHGNPHREGGGHEASVKSVAPVVLAQLKEAGVKGITDEKVARVDAAVMKSVTPEVAVATAEAKPKESAPQFAPPKVAPLVFNANGIAPVSNEKGAETIQGPNTVIPEPVKASLTEETGVKAAEVVASDKVQASPAMVLSSASPEVVPVVKMTSESPMVVPISLATAPTDTPETQALPQEATPKSTETPTIRTVGDFTIRSVRHLLGSGEETIEVRLNPRSLGALNVSVKTTGDSVEIVVTAASPMVREMLEVHLVGLKESLMKDGVEVSKVRVESHGTPPQDWSQSSSHQHLGSSNGEPKQGQPAQRGSGAYPSSEQENGRPKPSESTRLSMHEGELNLIA